MQANMRFGLQDDSMSFGEGGSEYAAENDASRPVPNIDVVPPGESNFLSDSESGFGGPLTTDHVNKLLDAAEHHVEEYPLVATQPLSQSQHYPYRPDMDHDLVGCLVPSSDKVPRFDLFKSAPGGSWRLGRHPTNDLVLPGLKLSNFHCTLKWNGKTGKKCEVVLADSSSNGTWVNHVQVSKGGTTILRSGAAISLGGQPDVPNDWRFIYRDIEGQSTRHMNQIWAKYDVGHELGSGSFARVHKCIERATSTEYAVKIIDRTNVRRSKSTERAIVREISILQQMAQFRHKNIVALHEHFEEDDAIYLILELVRGGDLLTYIGSHGRIGESDVRRMAAQICHAVACVHAQGITHRDLKPENVMMTATDPPDCKVADFGLAKLVDEATYLKTMCGTPAYLAPEVMLRGAHVGYDNKVDSWSLGVIFYCMLTNHAPFNEQYDPAASPEEQAHYFATRQIEWDLLADTGLSDDGMDFLRHLLVDDPRNRQEVMRMLDHHWISHLVPTDSQFQHPLPLSQTETSSSSTPRTTVTDGVALAFSESLENLNLSDVTIPGLPSTRKLIASQPSVSVSSLIPGAYPDSQKQKMGVGSSWEFVPPPQGKTKTKTRGAVHRAGAGDASSSPGPSVVPGKRKSNPIAGSSPLSSLSDSDSEQEQEHKSPPRRTARTTRAGARRGHKGDAGAGAGADGTRRSGRLQPAAKAARLS